MSKHLGSLSFLIYRFDKNSRIPNIDPGVQVSNIYARVFIKRIPETVPVTRVIGGRSETVRKLGEVVVGVHPSCRFLTLTDPRLSVASVQDDVTVVPGTFSSYIIITVARFPTSVAFPIILLLG